MTDDEKITLLVATVDRLIVSNEALMTHIDNVIREIRTDDALRGNERRRHGEAIAALEKRLDYAEAYNEALERRVNIWKPASLPGYAQIDLGSAKAISALEVAYPWGGAPASTGYSIAVSNDPTFTTSTIVASYDSAGTFQSYFGATIEEITVNPTVSARYVRVSAASLFPTFAEITVHGK